MDENKLWTVKDMIEKLNEFPQDMPVLYNDSKYPDLFQYLEPEVREVVEYKYSEDSASYYPAPGILPTPPPENRRFDAVILNGAAGEED